MEPISRLRICHRCFRNCEKDHTRIVLKDTIVQYLIQYGICFIELLCACILSEGNSSIQILEREARQGIIAYSTLYCTFNCRHCVGNVGIIEWLKTDINCSFLPRRSIQR